MLLNVAELTKMKQKSLLHSLRTGAFIAVLGGSLVAQGFLGAISRSGHGSYLTIHAGALSGPGATNGTGSAARFNYPSGITADSSGNIYVADSDENVIRKVTSAGVVTTFAGTMGVIGAINGTGTAAMFYLPTGLTCDSSGNVYVADTFNNLIRKITPAGVVTAFAGSGTVGSANGTGAAASFYGPNGVAVDSSGNVYVSDSSNNMIRKITSSGVVTTLAGSTTSGSTDGTGTAAKFFNPSGIAVDSSGNVYVSDTGNNTIRKITSAGAVTTIAGIAGTAGSINGTGITATFSSPKGIVVNNSSGNLYIADTANHTIRIMGISSGVVSTFAGAPGIYGYTDGTGTAALFHSPTGLGIDSSGNIYVDDYANNEVRKITSAQVVTTLAGSATTSSNGTGAGATFDQPNGIAADSFGNIYVAESGADVVRMISTGGVTTSLAGNSMVAGANNATGTSALFHTPTGAAVDSSANIYIADKNNCTIRKVTSGGVVTSFAGSFSCGYGDGTGTASTFNTPSAIAIDTSGNLYVADSGNNVIRKITSNGVVTTLAGSVGNAGTTDGTGTAAKFNNPTGIAVDSSGNIYVADTGNHTLRHITSSGVVTTFAGTAGTAGNLDGIGTAATFNGPTGIAVNPATGAIYIADTGNGLVRKMDSSGKVRTVVGAGSAKDISLTPLPAGLFQPQGLVVYAGMLYISSGNSILRCPSP